MATAAAILSSVSMRGSCQAGWGKNTRNSQNGNPSKINPEIVACFSSPKTDRQLTSFHQQSTTNSPSKHHAEMPVFAKTPSKNGQINSE
jgi:hypothetical protein